LLALPTRCAFNSGATAVQSAIWNAGDSIPQRDFRLGMELRLSRLFRLQVLWPAHWDSAMAVTICSTLAKKHITISVFNKNYKNFLISKFSAPEENIAVVHCGVDLTKTTPGKNHCVSNKIVTMARLEKTKALDHLVKAYKLLKDRGCDFEAIIIGEGPQRSGLQKTDRPAVLFAGVYLFLLRPHIGAVCVEKTVPVYLVF
jgi:glycosyltransferase involved in cell wall biosynthesis